MIKSYTIATSEVDNAEMAVRHVSEKLADVKPLANTICLISAHPEFVTSGVYEKVARSLPYPSVGMTTVLSGTGDEIDSHMLSIMILTSDDCEFAHGLSEPVDPSSGNNAEVTRKCYESVSAQLKDAPRLALLYTPFSLVPIQHEYIVGIKQANANLPIFGSIANDNQNSTTHKSGQRTLYCGEIFTDKLVMILISGNVDPKFYVATQSQESVIMPRLGVITGVDQFKLLSINNVSAAEFLKNAGFITSEDNDHNFGLLSSVFIMHIKSENGDEYEIKRIPFAVHDGSVICGGRLHVGASLSIALNTKEVVLESTREFMKTIKENHANGTILLHSCMGRRYGFLSNPFGEFEVVRDALSQDFNYMVDYSSGEICPHIFSDGKMENMELNQVLIACVL